MRKLNQLSKIAYTLIIVSLIIIIIILAALFNQMMSPIEVEEPKQLEEIIVYDPMVDWSTIKQQPLQEPKIDRELDGHFTDPLTTGCFFLAMQTLNIDVDIDNYYLTFFNENDEETYHEGKVSVEKLYHD